MKEMKGMAPDNSKYRYHKCSCGNEIIDMKQLHAISGKYRL